MWSKPQITPPADRPRLMLRQADIKQLRNTIKHVEMRDWYDRLLAFAPARSEDWVNLSMKGTLPVCYALESYSLQYLLDNHLQAGKHAVALALAAADRDFNPKLLDISREIGRLMLALAVVYDWCYKLLGEQEKKKLIASLKRLASLLECGYPPVHEGAFVGHTSEWMLMRDMMAAGIAIYGDDDEMYDYAAGRFLQEFLPARNFFYPSGWHHQGDNYGSYRYQADLFATWLFGRMGFNEVFDKSQEKIGYQWIYTRRPDGKLLRDGDTDNPLYEENHYIRLFPLVYLMAGNFYNNGYFLEQQQLEHSDIPDMYLFFAILFHNPQLAKKPIHELPLTRYFGEPAGIMVARTGWNNKNNMNKQANAAIVEMKIGMYQYNNHQHLDAGSFQIYYKGYLAIDSGIYKGSSGNYQSPHNKYYFKRTVAHNAMLVYDPNEAVEHPELLDGKLTWPNHPDGGQRWPGKGRAPKDLQELLGGEYERGKVLTHAFGPDSMEPDYSYLKGDITAAYSEKVKHYTRSFVFLNTKQQEIPALLIVLDSIESADKSFEKSWLLHSIEEPLVKGQRTVIARTEDGYSGELVVDTLLPKQATITSIGGNGKEFMVRGVNYRQDAPGTTEQGAWRIEVTPGVEAKHDLFLHVMQVKDHNGKPAPEVELIEFACGVASQATDQKNSPIAAIGAIVQDWLVLFCTSGQFGTEMIIPQLQRVECRRLLITDIKDGNWLIKIKQAGQITQEFKQSAAGGVLFLEQVEQGQIELERVRENER